MGCTAREMDNPSLIMLPSTTQEQQLMGKSLLFLNRSWWRVGNPLQTRLGIPQRLSNIPNNEGREFNGEMPTPGEDWIILVVPTVGEDETLSARDLSVFVDGVTVPLTSLSQRDGPRSGVAGYEPYKTLNEELGLPAEPVSPSMFVPRLASDLECPDAIRQRARTLAEQAEELGVTTGVHPAGFAAACLYKAGLEQERWATQTEVAEARNVTPPTVQTHRDTLAEQVI